MFEVVLELFYASVGSLGFSLLFNLRKEHLTVAVLGGTVEWAIYLMSELFFGGVFLPSVVAAAFAAVYAEAAARIRRAPATVFYIPALVPLIPGGSLYSTMGCVVRGEWEQARGFAANTMYCAVGIAVGLSITLSLGLAARKIVEENRLSKGTWSELIGTCSGERD